MTFERFGGAFLAVVITGVVAVGLAWLSTDVFEYSVPLKDWTRNKEGIRRGKAEGGRRPTGAFPRRAVRVYSRRRPVTPTFKEARS